MFDEMIEPNDIMQGELGDCWFMCAIASLAERPQLVRRLFITKNMNDCGMYRIRLCKNGEWVTVTVDDYFPCFPMGTPMFSRNHGNELWGLLLEKAYAKVHGSYKLLVGGWAYEGMMDLTGCPTLQYTFDEDKTDNLI
jgi:calpain-15